MKTIRTFIAIHIPELVKESISELQKSLKDVDARISWTRIDNMHITLKFLGDVDITRIERIGTVLEGALRDFKKFKVAIEGVGVFPDTRRPRVLWVSGVSENHLLEDMAAKIELALKELGFEAEKRKFTIHLTIGRVKEYTNIDKITSKLMENKEFRGGSFDVTEVILMQSELNPSGSIYTPLKIINLQS